jgi:Leucine Rich Repeat.
MELEKDRHVVEIADQNLKKAIINTLNQDKDQNISKDGDITLEQMKLLTDLDISSIEVYDLTGLQYATNLTNLVMDKTKVDGMKALITLLNDVAVRYQKKVTMDKSTMETTIKTIHSPMHQTQNQHSKANITQQPAITQSVKNDTTLVNIPDGNLKAKIISVLNTLYGQEIVENVSPKQMELLTVLYVNNCNISDISGIEYAKNLVEIRLDNNKISDITSLQSLVKLTFLSLSYNKITNIKPLASLNCLTSLNLSYNKVRNIAPLQYLSNLVYLNLSHNGIADIAPLGHLQVKANVSHQTIRIQKLHIPKPVYTFTHFLKTKKGVGLEVHKGTHVPDSWMLDASDIEDGIVFKNAVTHRVLLQMRITFQYYTLVEADSFSGQLLFDVVTTLTPIHIPDPVLRKSIIQVLKNCYNQNIQENTHIIASQMELLKVLDVSGLGVRDLTGLQYAKNLLNLNISGNAIGDISVISNLTNLVILVAHHNEIEDITTVKNLTNLVNLELQNNAISDVHSLGRLMNLKHLNLSHNQISNITPLQHIKGYINIREQTIKISQLVLTMQNQIIENVLKTPPGYGFHLQVGNHIPKLWQVTATPNGGIHFANVTPTEVKNDVDILFSYDCLAYSGRIVFATIRTSINIERTVDIPDSALRLTIVNILNIEHNQNISEGDQITENQLRLLTSLDVSGQNVKELTGLEFAVNLVKLNISHNLLTDIYPLRGNAKLAVLALHGNNLHSLAALKNLKGLISISIDNNLIHNISHLQGLMNLKIIKLHPSKEKLFHVDN